MRDRDFSQYKRIGQVRAPSIPNVDMSVQKNFPLTGRWFGTASAPRAITNTTFPGSFSFR